MRYLIILCFFLIIPLFVTAQNCADYHNKCKNAPRDYKMSSLSRSFSLRKMKKIAIKQTLFADRLYHISVCGQNKLGKLHIRVLADIPNRTVLFDNAADNFASEKTFQVESTLPIIIEINAPHFFDDNLSECAGISLSYKKL